MNVYDRAHELAKGLQESSEYTRYKELKERIFSSESDKELLKKYKKMQFEAQTAYMSGKQPDEETMDKLKKLGEVLQFNKDMTDFMSAEFMLNRMIGDIYKIIGDAVELDLDFLQE